MQTGWNAIYTRQGLELQVLRALKRLHVEAYCPECKVEYEAMGRKMTRKGVLFPSIVFFEAREEYHSRVRRIPGVLNLLYWINKPAVIDELEIAALKYFLEVNPCVRARKIDRRGNDLPAMQGIPDEGVTGPFPKKPVDQIVLASFGYLITALNEGSRPPFAAEKQSDVSVPAYLQSPAFHQVGSSLLQSS